MGESFGLGLGKKGYQPEKTTWLKDRGMTIGIER